MYANSTSTYQCDVLVYKRLFFFSFSKPFPLHFCGTQYSLLFLFFLVFLFTFLYIVFPRCSSDKYLVQRMPKIYMEKLYSYARMPNLYIKVIREFFLITFTWKLCSKVSFSKEAEKKLWVKVVHVVKVVLKNYPIKFVWNNYEVKVIYIIKDLLKNYHLIVMLKN